MTKVRLGTGLLGALAASAMLASAAPAEEYNLHSLPEVGRCVRVGGKPRHAGAEYVGARCIKSEPGGGRAFYNWRSGAGAKNKFSIKIQTPTHLKTASDEVTCMSGSAQGEYTGPKNFKLSPIVFLGCNVSPAASEEAALCQNSMANNGEITTKELIGDLGFISRARPKQPVVGFDLRPASEPNLAVFECGGANKLAGKSTGLGTSRELQGSVIGKTEPIDAMETERMLAFQSGGGTQLPESFQGGPKDTLTTLVGPSKTPAPTTLSATLKETDEERLEVLARCVGSGC
jgi:hypothetical protein